MLAYLVHLTKFVIENTDKNNVLRMTKPANMDKEEKHWRVLVIIQIEISELEKVNIIEKGNF